MPERNRNYRATLFEAFAIGAMICGVAVLTYAIGRSVGVDVGRNEVNARQHYEETKSGALAACVGLKATDLRECVIEAVESAQNQAESRQDLHAQQDMSRWAFWMMIISGLTLFVTGLGIVWIRDTLIETRRAVRAADDAVTVTREVGETQTRAYVHVEGAEVRWLNALGQFEGTSRQDVMSIITTTRNTGNTPARWYEIEGIVQVMERTQDRPKPLKTEAISVLRWGEIAPHGESRSHVVGEGIIDLFHQVGGNPNRMLRIKGLVRYETEFSEIRESPFAFFVDAEKINSMWLMADLGDRGELVKMVTKMLRPTIQSRDE
ncbi:hypothetical protein N4R57_00635 [Rhodobacteraceae bacterium D3-12]|nr:hypothetical protein N4R57_00635 [Rhodobacteraceae bacterium D3-12]